MAISFFVSKILTFIYKNDKINIMNIVSNIKYHIVFCTRYRKIIFNDKVFEEKFKEVIYQVAEENNLKILKLECIREHVYIYLISDPKFSPNEIFKIFKVSTTSMIRKEFDHLSKSYSVFTKNYLVSTEKNMTDEEINEFINSQKKRG